MEQSTIVGVILSLSILIGSVIVWRGLRAHAYTMYVTLIRHALVTNFSRFGQFKEWHSAVMTEENKAYFVRDGALWVCDVDGGEPIKSTARTVDLFTADVNLLKEVMMAVDTINTDAEDGDSSASV